MGGRASIKLVRNIVRVIPDAHIWQVFFCQIAKFMEIWPHHNIAKNFTKFCFEFSLLRRLAMVMESELNRNDAVTRTWRCKSCY